MDEIKWRQDEQAVEIVHDMELPHCVRQVSVRSEIDTKVPNGAREQAIDFDLVDDYVFAMRSGDKFPCIVLGQIDGKSKLHVVGGNHRLQAAVKIGAAEIPAIVVQCSAAAAAMLAKRLNISNGKRESRETRVMQGIDLVKHHGQTVDMAARIAGVSPNIIHSALRTERVRLRSIELGLPQSNKLRMTDGTAIGELVNDGDVFPGLYTLAITRGVGTEQFSAICRSVRKASTLAEKKAIIEKAQVECQSNKRSRTRMFPIASQIKRSVALLSNQTKGRATLLALQLTKEDVQQLLSELRDAVKNLETAIVKN